MALVAYTQFKRRQGRDAFLPVAVNAMGMPMMNDVAAPEYTEKDTEFVGCSSLEKASPLEISKERSSSQSSMSSSNSDKQPLPETMPAAQPVAILPQYITQHPTTITITELEVPHFKSSFKVLTADQREIFSVRRELLSLSERQVIIDPTLNAPVLSIRRLLGQRPMSYAVEDPSETKILEVQGNFSIPFQGAKSTTVFTNAMDGSKVNLHMKGSWENRRAAIRNEVTGDTLANLSSELLNFKNVLSGRRNYTVNIAGGVDVLLIVAMIVALDARAD